MSAAGPRVYEAHHCTDKAAYCLEEASKVADLPQAGVILAVADGWMALAALISKLPAPAGEEEGTP